MCLSIIQVWKLIDLRILGIQYNWKLAENTFLLMKVFRLNLQSKIISRLKTDSDNANEPIDYRLWAIVYRLFIIKGLGKYN